VIQAWHLSFPYQADAGAVNGANLPCVAAAVESPGSGDDQSPAWRRAWARPEHPVKEIDMALDNEQIIRQADQTAGRVTR
jgi:hypothetical protein